MGALRSRAPESFSATQQRRQQQQQQLLQKQHLQQQQGAANSRSATPNRSRSAATLPLTNARKAACMHPPSTPDAPIRCCSATGGRVSSASKSASAGRAGAEGGSSSSAIFLPSPKK